jgi:serine/threonine-protein phosphatase 6 regulatory ankyrin repeat subunit B
MFNQMEKINIQKAIIENDITKLKKHMINYKSNKLFIPLHFAIDRFIFSDNFEIIKYLIETSDNLNIQNNEGLTSLMYSIIYSKNKKLEIIKLLIANKINLNVQNEKGCTALMIALTFNYDSIARLLIESDANLDIKDNLGKTALMIAIRNYAELNIIEFLVNKNANLDIKDILDNTALHYALDYNDNVAKYLIENKANINIENKLGENAIIKLLQRNKKQETLHPKNYNMVKLLLKYNPDLKFTNKFGETINSFIYETDNVDVKEMFKVDTRIYQKLNDNLFYIKTSILLLLSIIISIIFIYL